MGSDAGVGANRLRTPLRATSTFPGGVTVVGVSGAGVFVQFRTMLRRPRGSVFRVSDDGSDGSEVSEVCEIGEVGGASGALRHQLFGCSSGLALGGSLTPLTALNLSLVYLQGYVALPFRLSLTNSAGVIPRRLS